VTRPVAAVVVTHGSDPCLKRCLEALAPQVDELVVVANPPAPETDARTILNKRPLGFAANANRGIAETTARYVVVANPDTVPRGDAVEILASFAEEHSRAGIVGPQLLFPDGRWQPSRRRFPTVVGTLVRRTPLRRILHPQTRQVDHYILDDRPTEPDQADWMLAAFLLLRREMLEELGGFDAGYRLYGEDIDLCYRAAKAGWERWYIPRAIVTHEHQAVTDERFLTRRTMWHARGIMRFVRKHPERLLSRYPRASVFATTRAMQTTRRSPIELPRGLNEAALREFLESVRVTDGPPEELRNYCRGDFWRFVRTFDLARDLQGRCLELGANPYFTTMLLREFANLELVLANYFGASSTGGPKNEAEESEQTVEYRDRKSGQMTETTFTSQLFNIEAGRFPYEDDSFDVVLFCEIIEHLTADPVAALREIKRVLRPGGVLVLTTPNVARLENVVKMIVGANLYDPYSGYGPYGRHNREYTKHDLKLLLTYLGFEVDYLESADVHHNMTPVGIDWKRPALPPELANSELLAQIKPLLQHRWADLGQYIFIRVRNSKPAGSKRPDFLFRSYPGDGLEPVSAAAARDVG
jgi:GT2 family glycosyltransferase